MAGLTTIIATPASLNWGISQEAKILQLGRYQKDLILVDRSESFLSTHIDIYSGIKFVGRIIDACLNGNQEPTKIIVIDSPKRSKVEARHLNFVSKHFSIKQFVFVEGNKYAEL